MIEERSIDHIIKEFSKLGYTLRKVACTNQKMLLENQGINAYGERSLAIDLLLESLCIDHLKDMPQVSEIYSEELGRYRFNRDGYKLIIDPLDGTKNYNMGISYYSCAIAVLDSANQLVAGYIINLSSGHEFYAVKGKGAYHLGKPIASGKYKSLQDCDGIFVGLSKEPAQIEVLNHFMARMNSYRALGCASLDICIVAKGKAGVFVDLSNTAKIVDVLASSIILEESGGTITDLEGIPITSYCCQSEDLERIVFNKKFCTVAAADKELHNLLLHSASNLVYNH